MTPDVADDLGDHLREYAERTGADVRFGLKDNGTWIDRRQLSGNGHPDTYTLRVIEEEDRYRMATTDGENTVIGRKRVTLSMPDFEPPDSDRQIIIDVSHGTSTPPEFSLREGQTFVVRAEDLDFESEFGPVHVNRVAGLDTEKTRLKNFLQPDNEDWGLSIPTGILLEGPPGTGKTELVMEVCEELYGSIPVTISGPETLSKWVGESERLLREKFKEARQRQHKVLYIDELDAIAQSRSDTAESYSAQIVAQLLVLLDGVSSKEDAATDEAPLKVIASTNLAEVVDSALRRPGRLGGRPIQFRRPDAAERTAILHHYLEQIRASKNGQLSSDLEENFVEDGSREYVEDVLAAADRCTGAEIKDAVQETVQRIHDSNDYTKVSAALLEGSEQFEKSTGITEEEIPVRIDDETTKREIEPGSYHVSQEDPREVAKHYFQTQLDDSGEDQICLYRELEPRDMLSNDTTQIREKVAHAFQQQSGEEVAIYLQHGDLLAQTQAHSPHVEALITSLNEQLIRRYDEVILLVPEAISEAAIPDTRHCSDKV